MSEPATSLPPTRRNSSWIWYFAVVAVLSVLFTFVLVRFNLAQQLTLAEVVAAERLWKEKGPADYDMEYTKQGSATGTFTVRVRNHRVERVICDGQPQEARLLPYSSMESLFGFIEDYLREDAKPGAPRVFTTGRFDDHDGHLLHYVRRVMESTERIELTVNLQEAPPEQPRGAAK
jgi:Family of unknown function (DUF6174)